MCPCCALPSPEVSINVDDAIAEKVLKSTAEKWAFFEQFLMLENEFQVYWIRYNHARWKSWNDNAQSFLAISLDTSGDCVRSANEEMETRVLILCKPTKQLLPWAEKNKSIA